MRENAMAEAPIIGVVEAKEASVAGRMAVTRSRCGGVMGDRRERR